MCFRSEYLCSGEIVWSDVAAAVNEDTTTINNKSKATGSAKKSKKSSSATTSFEPSSVDSEQHRVQVLRAVVESLVQRVAAFSAALLSEAVRALSHTSRSACVCVHSARSIHSHQRHYCGMQCE